MKFKSLLKILVIAVLLAGVWSFAHAYDYEYKNLDIVADIKIDGSIDVSETFDTYFNTSKHGIIRSIPLNYSVDGKDFHIEISNISVAGSKYSHSTNNGNIEIKIGDANKTVIGNQNYPISYSTYGLIRNFSGMGYAELYWNLVGYDFDTTIDKVRAELLLPKSYTGFTKEDFLVTTDGTTKTIDGFEGKVDFSQGDRIVITYDKQLSAYHGITLAVKFPNNYFEFNHKRQRQLIGYMGNQINIILLLSMFGAALFGFYLLRYFYCLYKSDFSNTINLSTIELILKEIKHKGPVVIQYTPPQDISPTEAGFLYDLLMKGNDFSCMIYKWCYEGLIKITANTSSFFKILKIKDIPDTYPNYETSFFYQLCPVKAGVEVRISNLDKFNLYGCQLMLLNSMKEKKYIQDSTTKKNPIKYIIYFFIIASIIYLLGFFIVKYIGIDNFISLNAIIIGISGGVLGFALFVLIGLPLYGLYLVFKKYLYISVFSKYGSFYEYGKEGKEIANQILGYAKFIKACDERQLAEFTRKDPQFANKTLPYAVAFGFGNEFINKISSIIQTNNVDVDTNIIHIPNLLNNLSKNIQVASIRTNEELHAYSEQSCGYKNKEITYSAKSGFNRGSVFDDGNGNKTRNLNWRHGGGGGGGGSRSW